MCNSLCQILLSRKWWHTILNDREEEKVLCRFQRAAFALHAAESASNLPCFSPRLKLQEKSLSTHQTRCCSGRPCCWGCLGSVYPATAHTSWPRRRGFPWASEPRRAVTQGKVCRCRWAARLPRVPRCRWWDASQPWILRAKLGRRKNYRLLRERKKE